MNNRNIIFAVVTIIVIVAAILVSQQRAPQTGKEKARLFPGLDGKINDVSEIMIRDSLNTLTIRRVSGKWRIAEADDYPALIDEVKQTVIATAELRLVAEKTANPDLYERLGVEAPDRQGATSHLLALRGNGNELATLIVGKPRRSQSPSHSPGLYVRLPEQAQALLVEGSLSVSADIIDWIKRDIINIESDRVRAIHARHKDASIVQLKRDAPGDELVLQNIPEGKEQESAYTINRMVALLENIYVEGVRSAADIDYSAPDSIIKIETFDGLTADVRVKKIDENTYAGFSFAVSPSSEPAENDVEEAAASDEVPARDDAGDEAGEPAAEEGVDDAVEETEAEEDAQATPGQEAEVLNALVNGWAYQLSESKAELFSKPFSDLVRDPG